MRVDGIYVSGYGSRIPARWSVAEALEAGECTPGLVARTDVESVAFAQDESAAEMAVRAGRAALVRAGVRPGDVGPVLHACTYHQGLDLWPVASYLQRELLPGADGSAVELRQMSNGGIAAMELAVARLQSGGRPEALVSAADRYCLPGIDRWRIDPGTPYGDGAAAVVLSRTGGFAAVRAVAVAGDATLEGLHRGDEPFGPVPMAGRMPIDFEMTKKAFLRDVGPSFAITRASAGQRNVVECALADADLDMADAAWVVLPHFGRRRLTSTFWRPFGIDPERTTWSWSRTVGHLGAADQFAGLAHLASTGRLRAGQHCVLISVGAGYSWGCVVLDILRDPPRRPGRTSSAGAGSTGSPGTGLRGSAP